MSALGRNTDDTSGGIDCQLSLPASSFFTGSFSSTNDDRLRLLIRKRKSKRGAFLAVNFAEFINPSP